MSTLLLFPRNNAYEDSQQRREKPSRKNSPNYSRLDSSKKFTTPSGWRILYLSSRRTMSGGCVSITQTSTNIVQKILSGFLVSTKSSTRRLVVFYYPFLTATQATIK